MMANHRRHVKNAIRLQTYGELRQFVQAFAEGHLNLLILIGSAGLAKSRIVRQAIEEQACWIEGNATPFGMYRKLWQYRNQLVVIDDVDSLYSDRSGVRLLKCLCQTEQRKTVAWHSAAAALDREAIPRQFVTTSRVAIISNDWKTLNRNVEAVEDRGHVVLFEPSAEEVHREAGSWFGDHEVYEWLGRQLHLISEPSLRHYVRASELKRAGMNWKRVVPLDASGWKLQLVAELKSDGRYADEAARVREFVARSAGCRATYFNYAKKLKRAA